MDNRSDGPPPPPRAPRAVPARLDARRRRGDALTTSTVSQQIATLAREAGTPLVEPVGRRVRLTPAGRRLADHAVTILAAVDAARLDLDPDAEPVGLVRVAGFATAIRRSLLPAVRDLAETHPGVEMRIHEYEPLEALDLLPATTSTWPWSTTTTSRRSRCHPTWSPLPCGRWRGGSASRRARAPPRTGRPGGVRRPRLDRELAQHRRRGGRAHPGSLVGFTPRVMHRIDSLELVEDLIEAGRGVGLLPGLERRARRPGAAARRAGRAAAGVRRGPPRPRGLAAAPAAARPARRERLARRTDTGPTRREDPGNAERPGYKSPGPARYELAGPLPSLIRFADVPPSWK